MVRSSKSRELRSQIQTVLRRLGALADDKTPCGKDLPVSDAHALQLLRERGPLPQSTLEALLGINKSSVSRLRARLEETGRIEATPARMRGRPISVLALTERGRRLAAELDEASGERFASLLQQIPEGRREQVLAALGDLNAALARLEPTASAGPEVDSDEASRLSRRQLEVMRLVAEGLSSHQIGDRLAIGRRTVETHRLHISRKLGLRTAADIRRYVAERGLARPSAPGR
jgi:DNA-binding CsgD family transcriptional regulator/DNA-binding MarR family transcriptional regulator